MVNDKNEDMLLSSCDANLKSEDAANDKELSKLSLDEALTRSNSYEENLLTRAGGQIKATVLSATSSFDGVTSVPQQVTKKQKLPESLRSSKNKSDEEEFISHTTEMGNITPVLGYQPSRIPLIDDTSDYSEDNADNDHSRHSSEVVVVAMGIPEDDYFSTSEDDVTIKNEKQKTQIATRAKSAVELDQEEIDRTLAENIAINQSNAKHGKKSLEEIIDPTMILRRHTALPRSTHFTKSTESTLEANLESSSGPPIGDDRFSKSQIHTQGAISKTISEERSASFTGNGLSGIAATEIRDEADLIVQPEDRPVTLSRPGAYAIAGISARRGSSESIDDTFDEEETNYQGTHASTLTSTATFHRVQSSVSSSSFVVVGRVIKDDDELTEEERKERIVNWRRTQTRILFCITMIIAIVFVVLIVGNRKNSMSHDGHTHTYNWVSLGSFLNGPKDDDKLYFGNSVSLSRDGKRLATGMPGFDASTANIDVGQVRVFDLQQNNWKLSAKLQFTSPKGKAGDAVAISANGRRIIVGAPYSKDGVGLASVWQEVESKWSLVGTELSGRDYDGNGHFGFTVAISEDGLIIAIGAPFVTTSSAGGVVRVYAEQNLKWNQLGQDISSVENDALLGSSISLSGDGKRIAIGAKNIGQVVVYDFDGTQWIHAGSTMTNENPSVFSSDFGDSVALSSEGNVLAVGESRSLGSGKRIYSGKVQVFYFKDRHWIKMGDAILGKGAENLGASVAMADDGSLLVVGCPQRELGKAGHVKIYSYDTATGWQQGNVVIRGSVENEKFGTSVAISANGDTVAIGAPFSDYDGRRDQVGKVYLFKQMQR